MMALCDEDLKAMGEYSRQLAEQKFDEQLVINKYLDTIRLLTSENTVK